jgi:predicted phage-related endonuclease
VSRPIIIECEQRTPEWFAARAGRLTGSVAADMVAKLKSGGEAASRRDLRINLAVERILGRAIESDGFTTKDMQRGIDCEPLAIAAYEAETGNLVRQTGFVIREDHSVGCSLDGDINEFEGILELKCPKSATHISYLRDQRLPPAYAAQVTHNVWVTGAKWCDFYSFDDRLPEGLQTFRFRVMREQLDLAGYELEVKRFLAEVSVEAADLLKLRGVLAA